MRYASIEAGGTKFNCAITDESFQIIDRVQFPTLKPEETMANVFEFFDGQTFDAIGIGSFGPIDMREGSDTYGYITSTPKTAWQHFNFLGAIQDRYELPTAWTTDVNASGMAEYRLGAGKAVDSSLYLTVGTGVGGGYISKGQVLTGMNHLELGHVIVKKHPDDSYEGHCPYHKDCLEGLICGPAIEDRFAGDIKAKDISPEDPVWEYVAYYLAQGLRNFALTLMPEKIILGGGVMHQPQLLARVKEDFDRVWHDYLPLPDLDDYIVRPELGDDAGLIGGAIFAKEAYSKSQA